MPGTKYQIMKGDRVRVIRGNDREAEGNVLEVIKDTRQVRVEGVNMRKRHTRPSEANPHGRILSFDAPITLAKLRVSDPATHEPTRVRVRIEEDGTKERIAVKSGNPIPRPQ